MRVVGRLTARIFVVRDLFKVFWIYAAAVKTKMVYLKTLNQFTTFDLIAKSMGKSRAKFSISIAVQKASPNPTAAFFFYF